MILTIYNLILDGSLLAGVEPPHGLAITSCLMILLLSSWFLWNQSRTFSLSNKRIDSISLQSLATMENQLWNQSLGSTLTSSQAVLGILAEGLDRNNQLGNAQRRKFHISGLRGHHEQMKLFADYLFVVYFAKYNSKLQALDVEWAFSFAYFLLRWKKHVYLLMALHRSLTSAALSLRHSVSLAVLEAAITRQLQTQDAQFSYFFSEWWSFCVWSSESPAAQAAHTKNKSAQLDIYHIIETVSAFEHLVDQMRIQLRLQSQFLTAVESRSQPVAAVHSAVSVITEQRTLCKTLFDDLHAAADSAQTFHLLPFAFFLEHTENNLERRVELVKTYYFKSQVRRVHGRLFNELVDESVTVVSESERSRLGHITHSSKNAALVFGADVGALEGRSLDVFFHAEMAAAHRRQMREYLQHFDRPYLGEERERYVTVGNGVYYRVECVTKFVPHLREGFQFATKLKHLGEEEGKYGRMDDAGIQIVVDDHLRIQGIGYNHSLIKRTDLNDEVTRNAASKKEHSTNKVALNAALTILPEIEGKNLSALSYELAQKVNEKLEQLHLSLNGHTKPEQLRADQQGKVDLDLKNLASIDSSPDLSVRPNQAFSSHKVSTKDPKTHTAPVQPLNSPVMESGDFIVAIDIAKGFVISEADNEVSGSEFSDEEQAHMKIVEQDSKLRLFLNFTHYCFIPNGPENAKIGWHQQKAKQSKPKVSTKSPMWQLETRMLGTESKSNEKDDFLAVNQTRFGAGMTLIRIQNPNKIENLVLNNTVERANLSLDRKNSVYEIAGEFDPLKLISRLINIRNCQELIHNYMTRPELAEIGLDPPTNEETNIDPQLLKPLDSAPVCTPMAGKAIAGQALLKKFIPEGQLQLSIPDRYSALRTSSLENNVASVQSVEQSQSHTQLATLMPWQTSREKEKEKEGKSILGKKHANKSKKASMTLGASAQTHREAITAGPKMSILGPTRDKSAQKGIITKTIHGRSRQKFHTTTVQQHKHVDKEDGSLKSHKTKSKGASQKNEDHLFLGEHHTTANLLR